MKNYKMKRLLIFIFVFLATSVFYQSGNVLVDANSFSAMKTIALTQLKPTTASNKIIPMATPKSTSTLKQLTAPPSPTSALQPLKPVFSIAKVSTTRNFANMLSKLEKVESTLKPASLETKFILNDNVMGLKKGELKSLLSHSSGNVGFDNLDDSGKVANGLIIGKTLTEQYFKRINKQTIFYDEQNNIVAKVDPSHLGKSNETCTITNPSLQEVLKDIQVNPGHKTITLNKANLRYFDMNKNALKSLSSVSNGPSGTMQTKSLTNPMSLVDLNFDNKSLSGFDENNSAVDVTLTGYLRIGAINVDGDYGFFSGYRIALNSGVDAKLTAKFTASHGNIRIPLYGIDIPAGIAHVGGGIYLMINNQSEFTLQIDTESHASLTAGLQGSTKFGVPTSIHPILEPKLAFSATPSFVGKVDGTVTAGPCVFLNIWGWDIVSANIGIGAGVHTNNIVDAIGDKYLDCDIYGYLGANAAIFGKGITLCDLPVPLYSFKKENTMGYDLTFNEINAYTHHISGLLQYDDHGIKPLSDSKFYVSVKRANPTHKAFSDIVINTNQDGKFDITLNQELYNGDKVKVYQVYNAKLKKIDNPTFKTVSPTIPFKAPVIQYADFFNDEIRGLVAPAVSTDYITGEQKTVFYNGDIQLLMCQTDVTGQKKITPAYTALPSLNIKSVNGVIDKNQNVAPGLVIQPVLTYNDFEIPGKAVASDVDFKGLRMNTVLTKDEDTEHITSKEQFYLINMRGTKQLSGIGVYEPITFNGFSISFGTQTVSAMENYIEKCFFRSIKPVQDSGNSSMIYGVSPYGSDIAKLAVKLNTGGTSLVETNFNYYLIAGSNTVFDGATKKPVDKFDTRDINAASQNLPDIIKPKAGSQNLDPVTWNGVAGQIMVNIKGVFVIIADANDKIPGAGGGGKGGMSVKPNLENMIFSNYWSRVNPNPVDNSINLYKPTLQNKSDIGQ